MDGDELAGALRALASARPEAGAVFDLTARTTRDLLDAPSVIVAVAEGDQLVARAVAGHPVVGTGDSLPRSHSIAGRVVDTGEATLCVDGWADERTDAAHNLAHRTRSSAVAPLLYQGHALGCVSVLSPEPNAFDPACLDRLALLADVAASRLAYALSLDAQADIAAQLAGQTRRLAAAQRLTGLATWSWDYVTGHLVWDEQMYVLAGLAPWSVEPTFDLLVSRMHPDDRDDARRLGDEAIARGQGYQNVFRVVDDDGTVRHLLAWTEVVPDPVGRTPGLRGATVDISDRARATALATLAQSRFRAAFDDAPIGMVMASLHAATAGHVLRVNAAFRAMTGLAPDAPCPQTLAEVTHPDDVSDDARAQRQLTSGEASHVSLQRRFVRPDGTVVPTWITATATYDESGTPDFVIAHCVDMTERLDAEQKLHRLALTDVLTGLANRQLLGDRLVAALARGGPDGGDIALLMLDLDQFKLVNDTLGHQAGDGLLVEVAARLRALCPPTATIGRPGGDEFIILVEDLPYPEAVEELAELLVAELARPYYVGPSGTPIVTTVSIGVTTTSPSTNQQRTLSGDRPNDLYREADLALYRAKDAGRNRWAAFDGTLRARAQMRLDVEQRLRQALTGNQLAVAYQPLLDLHTGTWTGPESLVRLRDPERGEIAPGEFIEVAEETGLIVDIDRWVLTTALHQLSLWRGMALPTMPVIGVNASAHTISQPGFADDVAALLAATGLPGRALQLELTERTLLDASPTALAAVHALAALGVGLGLDDFGTGYSALAYLQRFPLTFLKIDQSFTARLGQSDRDDAVVSAIIALGHAHGLQVVAEGVETLEQLQFLYDAGADVAQGYLLGRPMTADAFRAHVHRPWPLDRAEVATAVGLG